MAVEKVYRFGLTDIRRCVFECKCGALSAPSAMRLSDRDSCPGCHDLWTRALDANTVEATNMVLRGIEHLATREREVLRLEVALEP